MTEDADKRMALVKRHPRAVEFLDFANKLSGLDGSPLTDLTKLDPKAVEELVGQGLQFLEDMLKAGESIPTIGTALGLGRMVIHLIRGSLPATAAASAPVTPVVSSIGPIITEPVVDEARLRCGYCRYHHPAIDQTMNTPYPACYVDVPQMTGSPLPVVPLCPPDRYACRHFEDRPRRTALSVPTLRPSPFTRTD